MNERGVALYLVVTLLAVLGFLGIAAVWVATSHAEGARRAWLGAEAYAGEAYALNGLYRNVWSGVEGALRGAIATGTNLQATQYLSNPSAVAQAAQASLPGGGCPSGTFTKADNRQGSWKAYIFLTDTTVCSRTPASFSASPPAPGRLEGADRSTWTALMSTYSNAPLQVYIFPVLVALEVTDSSTGERTVKLYRGNFRALVGPPQLGWWTFGAYPLATVSLSPNLEIRGKAYLASPPRFSPPLNYSGSLHTPRCSPSVGTSCSKTYSLPYGSGNVDLRTLSPSPWSPCFSAGCVRLAGGIDWTLTAPLSVAYTASADSIVRTNLYSNPTLSFSSGSGFQTLTISSGLSSESYTIRRTASGTYTLNNSLITYAGINLVLNFTGPLTVNGGTLNLEGDFLSRVRITVRAPSITVAQGPRGNPNPCQDQGLPSCSGSVLPVLLAADDLLTVTAGEVHAFLLGARVNLSSAPRVFGGLHFTQTLTLPSTGRVVLIHNPAAATAPFPGYPALTTAAQPASLAFDGLTPSQ